MLALIGGIMLASAVGAMVMLAGWSLARDDDPDSRPRDGILALRDWSERTLKRNSREKRNVTTRERVKEAKSRRRSVTMRRLGKPKFDAMEMAEIEDEIALRERAAIQDEHRAATAELSLKSREGNA